MGMSMPAEVADLFINSIGRVERLEGDVLRVYLCVERPQEEGPSVEEAVIAVIVPRTAISNAIQKIAAVAGSWDNEDVKRILNLH